MACSAQRCLRRRLVAASRRPLGPGRSEAGCPCSPTCRWLLMVQSKKNFPKEKKEVLKGDWSNKSELKSIPIFLQSARKRKKLKPKEVQRRITAPCIRLVQGACRPGSWHQGSRGRMRRCEGRVLVVLSPGLPALATSDGLHTACRNNWQWRRRRRDVMVQCREAGV